MNAPPHEKAAGMLVTPATADKKQSDPSVDDERFECQRLAALQQLAADLGASLNRVQSGFMLRCATHSWHSPALDAITKVLARLEVRQ